MKKNNAEKYKYKEQSSQLKMKAEYKERQTHHLTKSRTESDEWNENETKQKRVIKNSVVTNAERYSQQRR